MAYASSRERRVVVLLGIQIHQMQQQQAGLVVLQQPERGQRATTVVIQLLSE